ncbi:MAG: PstS family phosphate ABC transporter substrate-binding protein [Synechococcales cyanobacterium C42_A2020_086]|jgi:phosphate transport system substrate-binding protein|nr:PstS family phosphate ABC transporter substrate-binding protein [Synechococcales cyanobacterium M58_A2018_015]MBF2073367.1 PstS family phosphate ABC transporter substrate-binding protein [Synechococcales cyanobacterium C42_A2020_086]
MVFQFEKTSGKALRVPLFAVATGLLVAACSPAPTTTTQPGTTDSSPVEQTNAPAELTGAAVATPEVEVDGSSTVFPITNAAAEEFQKENPDAKVIVEFSGTTGGFRKFCAGETDISNASRPISSEEIVTCREAGVRFIELPIAFDALTVVVHPENTWAQSLTVSELKKMWEPAAQGKITNWNQIRPDFPNRPLKLYGAGTDSGTYDYFAEVITGGSDLRSDFTASEDDDVLVQGVANDPDALGFFGFSYFERNQDKLRAVAILDDSQGRATEAVLPSREAVENATYVPLSRPLFVYVNGRAAQQNPNLRDFMTFYLTNAQRIVESVDYIPMPGEAYEVGSVHLFKGEYGTAYDGKPQPYLTIREVLQKEQSL